MKRDSVFDEVIQANGRSQALTNVSLSTRLKRNVKKAETPCGGEVSQQ